MIHIDPDARVPIEFRQIFREMIASNETIYSLIVYPSDTVDAIYVNEASNESQMRMRREIVPLTRSSSSWKAFLSAMKISHARAGAAIDAALESINNGD